MKNDKDRSTLRTFSGFNFFEGQAAELEYIYIYISQENDPKRSEEIRGLICLLPFLSRESRVEDNIRSHCLLMRHPLKTSLVALQCVALYPLPSLPV